MPSLGEASRRLAVPALLLVGVALLWTRILSNESALGRLPGLGPAAWPRFMLGALGVCAALWLAKEIIALARGKPREVGTIIGAADQSEEGYDYRIAVAGLALVVAYGAAIPYIGFPLATFIFMLSWCLLGRIRQPLVFLPVSLLGTIALLYVFAGLASMPLNRGVGAFDTFTIRLFQLLRIY